MKVLLTGADGQLGRALVRTAPEQVKIVALGHREFDICDAGQVQRRAASERPDLIVNAAAYTAVDKAESERERAFAVNRDGVANLAASGVRLVQISTDYVFDGEASSPYPVDAPTGPINVYGASKLAGEKAAGEDALIVRTSWLYHPDGANFVTTMLRLMRERGTVKVVNDQFGTPTSAVSAASAIWALAMQDARGTCHATDSAVASWYDLAVAIAEEARASGLLATMPEVLPVSTSHFPTPARRPAYSVLDTGKTEAMLGRKAPHWRDNARAAIAQVKRHG